jgi:hypothetical protein
MPSAKNCTTYAKLRTIEECERVRQFESANCDTVSRPGYALCDMTRKSTISTSFCTR